MRINGGHEHEREKKKEDIGTFFENRKGRYK